MSLCPGRSRGHDEVCAAMGKPPGNMRKAVHHSYGIWDMHIGSSRGPRGQQLARPSEEATREQADEPTGCDGAAQR